MSTQTETHAAHGHDAHGDGHGAHASVGFYWTIGFILAALTGLEVAAYYMELGSVEVPLLLILSAAKFILVVGFFMHLKFDSRIFTGVFVAGLAVAVFMVSALMVIYHWLPGAA
jgi:cytochrome c oxidase subunit 4